MYQYEMNGQIVRISCQIAIDVFSATCTWNMYVCMYVMYLVRTEQQLTLVLSKVGQKQWHLRRTHHPPIIVPNDDVPTAIQVKDRECPYLLRECHVRFHSFNYF